MDLTISKIYCNFIVSKYKELQTKIAIITGSKVTDIFCIADDFYKFYDAMVEKNTLPRHAKRIYHRKSTLSKTEVMMILILFHNSGYRCLKHSYLDEVSKYLRHLFPKVISYNRFVKLAKEVLSICPCLSKKLLMGKCTEVSFMDSTLCGYVKTTDPYP